MGEWMEFAQNASRMNSLRDHMDMVTGVRTFDRTQIPLPPRPIQGGSVVLNNIRIENSTVGVINTGDVKSIDSVVSAVKAKGNDKLALGLRDFTEAVIGDQSLPQQSKNEVLSQLAFLSQQVIAEQKESPSVMGAVVSGIERAINLSASLVTLWPLLHAMLKPLLGA